MHSNQDLPANLLKSKSHSILIIASAFFLFQLYLLINSLQAVLQVFRLVSQEGFTFWGKYWLISALVGEGALVVRFFGACFFLVFAVLVVRKGMFALAHLGRGVFLEGIHYFFFVIFISYLFIQPNASMITYLAGFSYILQLLVVAPPFFMLYLQLRDPASEPLRLFKWGGITAVGFIFALWVKHFLFSLYAIPVHFSFESPVLLLGSINSAFTLLVAAILLAVALMPSINRAMNPKWRLAGLSLLIASVYFFIYIFVAFYDIIYLSYIDLTELWASSFIVAGFSFMLYKTV
jgi:hypothetical protein